MQHNNEPVPIATFQQLLATCNDGRLHAGLSTDIRDGMMDLHQREASGGGKQKMKIVVTLELETKDGVVEMKGDYAVKLPPRPRPKTILWSLGDGRLQTSNPKQLDMLRAIDGAGTTQAAPAAVPVAGSAVVAQVPTIPQTAVPGGDD